MNSVVKALRSCGQKLMDFPNVVGVGYGHKRGREKHGKESWSYWWRRKCPLKN